MKILLINPNRAYHNLVSSVAIGLPVGLLYVAASLERHGVEVEILDCLSSPKTRIRRGIRRTFIGLDEETIAAELRARKPDVVGIGCPFTTQWQNALDCIRIVAQAAPHARLVLGGPHASADAEAILSNTPDVDYVIAGEGELAMCALADSIASKNTEGLAAIPGLVWRDADGGIVANRIVPIEEVDALPLPAYHLIDVEKYFALNRAGFSSRRQAGRALSVITSRGCPFACVFCSVHITMGHKWRPHGVDYVLDHIRHLATVLHARHVHIEDDNFTYGAERAKEICRRIAHANMPVTWDTPNGVRADRLDDEFLRLAKQSGCTGLMIAAESGDQAVLDDVIGKKISLDSIVLAAKMCRQHRIRLGCFFVVGIPGENRGSIRKTLKFAAMLWWKYRVFPHVHLAAPLPGTDLERRSRREGCLVEALSPQMLAYSISPRGRGVISTPEFSPSFVRSRALLFYYRLFLATLMNRPLELGRFSVVSNLFRLF